LPLDTVYSIGVEHAIGPD